MYLGQSLKSEFDFNIIKRTFRQRCMPDIKYVKEVRCF